MNCEVENTIKQTQKRRPVQILDSTSQAASLDGSFFIELTQGKRAIVDAAIAYDKKALDLFGEFALLNSDIFPELKKVRIEG